MYSQEEFSKFCNKKLCLRKTTTDFNGKQKCFTELKQQRCFKKYITVSERRDARKKESSKKRKVFKVDENYKAIIDQVKIRDNNECQIWKYLSQRCKDYILSNYKDEYNFMSKTIYPEHILPQGTNPELYDDPENIILTSAYFARLMTDGKNPVTRKDMPKKERLDILYKAKNKEIIDFDL